MVATYLSVDLDFFDGDYPNGDRMLAGLLSKIKDLEIPVKVVMSHEGLVEHIRKLRSEFKFRRLINLDEHSDASGLFYQSIERRVKGGPYSAKWVWKSGEEPHCGNWIDYTGPLMGKPSTYTWVIPPNSSGTDCRYYDEIVRWGWRRRQKRLCKPQDVEGASRLVLPWSRIKACGIALSPDYVCRTRYWVLRDMVAKFFPLPRNCGVEEAKHNQLRRANESN